MSNNNNSDVIESYEMLEKYIEPECIEFISRNDGSKQNIESNLRYASLFFLFHNAYKKYPLLTMKVLYSCVNRYKLSDDNLKYIRVIYNKANKIKNDEHNNDDEYINALYYAITAVYAKYLCNAKCYKLGLFLKQQCKTYFNNNTNKQHLTSICKEFLWCDTDTENETQYNELQQNISNKKEEILQFIQTIDNEDNNSETNMNQFYVPKEWHDNTITYLKNDDINNEIEFPGEINTFDLIDDDININIDNDKALTMSFVLKPSNQIQSIKLNENIYSTLSKYFFPSVHIQTNVYNESESKQIQLTIYFMNKCTSSSNPNYQLNSVKIKVNNYKELELNMINILKNQFQLMKFYLLLNHKALNWILLKLITQTSDNKQIYFTNNYLKEITETLGENYIQTPSSSDSKNKDNNINYNNNNNELIIIADLFNHIQFLQEDSNNKCRLTLTSLLRRSHIYHQMIKNSYNENVCLFGIRNLGNTCYINSSIQSLIRSSPLFRLNLQQQEYNSSDYYLLSSTCNFLLTINKLKCNNKVLTLTSLREAISVDFDGKYLDKAQHDASEFIGDYLNALNNYLSKPPLTKLKQFHKYGSIALKYLSEKELTTEREKNYSYSIISDIFEGNQVNIFTCNNKTCNKQKVYKIEQFFIKSVALRATQSNIYCKAIGLYGEFYPNKIKLLNNIISESTVIYFYDNGNIKYIQNPIDDIIHDDHLQNDKEILIYTLPYDKTKPKCINIFIVPLLINKDTKLQNYKQIIGNVYLRTNSHPTTYSRDILLTYPCYMKYELNKDKSSSLSDLYKQITIYIQTCFNNYTQLKEHLPNVLQYKLKRFYSEPLCQKIPIETNTPIVLYYDATPVIDTSHIQNIIPLQLHTSSNIINDHKVITESKSTVKLTECLEAAFGCKYGGLTCPGCKLERSVTSFITKLPPCLIIHANRGKFVSNSRENVLRKNKCLIQYDTELDLFPYCTKELKEKYDRKYFKYELYSHIRHSGDVLSGHYISASKVSSSSNVWYDFSDAHISKRNSYYDPNAYVFFYLRKVE